MKQKESYHHGDLRQAIIQEALAWIDTEGIATLSLRNIARKLGVSHNAPYRHFEDKETLLAEIAQEGFIQLTQNLKQGLAEKDLNPQQRIAAVGVAYINYAITNSAHYRVMFGTNCKNEQKYPTLEQVSLDSFMVLVDAIKEGQIAKVIRIDEPKKLAYICWSLVHGLSMLLIDNQLKITDEKSALELANMATQMMLSGLVIKE